MIRNKSMQGGVSGDLFVFKLFNCILWMFYGLPMVHPHNFWVFLTNSFGCLFALSYISLYLYYASRKQRGRIICELGTILLLFGVLVVVVLLYKDYPRLKVMIAGTVCAVISSLMHLTLLSQMGKLLKTKDTKYFLPYSSVGAFFKGAVWTAYGLVNLDIYIMVPNGFGIIIGTIQLILFIIVLYTRNIEVTKVDFVDDLNLKIVDQVGSTKPVQMNLDVKTPCVNP
ncbi:hypothetical protein KP509_06G033300 [Ceratopteris richardii]|nr:hypothetical protein KP509_06G033300 [Ceratopteris richardii]KAH7434759.1 hypothetical protein KP509_06G033300 [Ceratopteris richardii]